MTKVSDDKAKFLSECVTASIMLSVAAKMAANCKTVVEAAALIEREAIRLAHLSGYPTLGNPLAGDAEYCSWFPSPGDAEFSSWQEAA